MSERVETGVVGLDEMLRGGLTPRTVVLVRGAPGVGKTTLGLQFLYHGALQKGEPGLFITFEQFPESLYRDAQALGWDLRALEAEGKLRILFTSPQVLLHSLQAPTSPIAELIREQGTCRVVVDSMAHFRKLATDPISLRKVYEQTTNALKREGVTSLLLSEAANKLSFLREEAEGLLFVVDGVILLSFVEMDGEMCRALTVLKFRGSDHDKEVRRFEIGQGGIRLSGDFANHEALLTGAARLNQVRRTLGI
jgi:circadian clock protein KaiC